MLRKIGHFLFHRPEAEESRLVRLAMFTLGALCLIGGVAAAVQLHWAGLLLLPFSGLILVAWWMTVRRRSARATAQPGPLPRLTSAALAHVAQSVKEQEAIGPVYLRLETAYPAGGGREPSLRFDLFPDPKRDCLIAQEGVSLVVAQDELDYFAGCLIDFVEADGAHGFAFLRQSRHEAR
jgi:Fe-S cluster assembly iron-binding protein IscA